MITDASEKDGSREVESASRHASSATGSGCLYGSFPFHSLRYKSSLYSGTACGAECKDPSIPYERRSGEIAEALWLSSATTSEHLRQLAKLHLVTTRKQGTAVYYRLSNHMLVQAFLDLLQALDSHYQKQQS
jgi:DNA-binding transcriptional ArsR family regulator